MDDQAGPLCAVQALYQPQGGFLESEVAIKTHVNMAQKLGAEVRTDAAVKG